MLACINNILRQGPAKSRSAQRLKTRSVPQVKPVALHHRPLARPQRCRHLASFPWPKRHRVHLAGIILASTLWRLQPRVASEAMPPAQLLLPTVSFRASIHPSMAMVGTEALTRQTERSSPGWQLGMGMFTTHMAVLGSFNPNRDVRRLMICSRAPSKGVGSLLRRYSSQTAMGVGLMESVKTDRRSDAGMDIRSRLQLTVRLNLVWPAPILHPGRACRTLIKAKTRV